MKEALIKLLERADIDDLCEDPFDGKCRDLDCDDCPFHSDANKAKLIAELKGE